MTEAQSSGAEHTLNHDFTLDHPSIEVSEILNSLELGGQILDLLHLSPSGVNKSKNLTLSSDADHLLVGETGGK